MAQQPIPRYVACAPFSSRVTLTAELPRPRGSFRSTVDFLGEFEGEAVVVEVYAAPDILAIRRVLAEGRAAVFDTPTYRMSLASATQRATAELVPVPSSMEDALAALNVRAHRELDAAS